MNKKELKEILDQHQLWLDSDCEQGRRADLWDADLRGADLAGVNLYRAELDGADLRRADLRGVNLYEANLTRAELIGAQLGPEIRECWGFPQARVSEDQLAWLCLHPRFSEWVSGLVIV